MTALTRLDAAVQAAVDAGQHPPCLVEINAPLWLSERREDRDAATELCAPCPLLGPCGTAAEEEGATFGVWGGRDVTQRPGKARTPPKPRPPKPRPALDPITCHGCGELFTPSRAGHLYCRQACRTRLASAERRRKARENTEKETTA